MKFGRCCCCCHRLNSNSSSSSSNGGGNISSGISSCACGSSPKAFCAEKYARELKCRRRCRRCCLRRRVAHTFATDQRRARLKGAEKHLTILREWERERSESVVALNELWIPLPSSWNDKTKNEPIKLIWKCIWKHQLYNFTYYI